MPRHRTLEHRRPREDHYDNNDCPPTRRNCRRGRGDDGARFLAGRRERRWRWRWGVNSSGQCSTISGWTLQAQATGSSIDVRADVFSKELDSTWTWKLFDNGQKFAKGTAIMNRERRDFTYFEVRRSTADEQGSDDIRFVATQTATGEVCDGSLLV